MITTTFYGNKISNYGLEHGYVDYRTLAQAFNHILANDFMKLTESEDGYWEPYCGKEYWEDEDGHEYPLEVFQWYLIDKNGAEILEYWTDEIVYYNEYLDMYLWGVTHYGTAWDYVLTDIKLCPDEEET